MDNISPEDELAVAFSSAGVYGIYLVSFFLCLKWQIFTSEGWRTMLRRNRIHVSIAFVIFALTTAYVALQLVKSRAFVYATVHHTRTSPPGTQPWYSAATCTVANTMALLVDSVVIYRCWVVYGKSLIVISFPCLMWIGGLICTILQLYWQTVQTGVLGPGKWVPVNMTVGLGTVLTPFWATTILLNTYTTYMLIRRLYHAGKTSDPGVTDSINTFNFIARILAESGFLYFVTTLAHFIVWWTPSNLAIRIASQINIPTIAIAFNLVLIRVGKNRAMETSGSVGSTNAQVMSSMRYATSSEGDMSSQGFSKEEQSV